MALEAYASGKRDEVHTDALLQARLLMIFIWVWVKSSREEYVKSCRVSWVKHFDRQYCKTKRTRRLLDDKEMRRGPLSLPQPYTFKPPTSA